MNKNEEAHVYHLINSGKTLIRKDSQLDLKFSYSARLKFCLYLRYDTINRCQLLGTYEAFNKDPKRYVETHRIHWNKEKRTFELEEK